MKIKFSSRCFGLPFGLDPWLRPWKDSVITVFKRNEQNGVMLKWLYRSTRSSSALAQAFEIPQRALIFLTEIVILSSGRFCITWKLIGLIYLKR